MTQFTSAYERIATFVENTGAKFLRTFKTGEREGNTQIQKYVLASGELLLVERIPPRADQGEDSAGVEVYCPLTTSARLDTMEQGINALAAGVRQLRRHALPAFLLDEPVVNVTRALAEYYEGLAATNVAEAKRWLSIAEQRTDDEAALGFVESHANKVKEYRASASLYRAMFLAAKEGETLGEPA